MEKLINEIKSIKIAAINRYQTKYIDWEEYSRMIREYEGAVKWMRIMGSMEIDPNVK